MDHYKARVGRLDRDTLVTSFKRSSSNWDAAVVGGHVRDVNDALLAPRASISSEPSRDSINTPTKLFTRSGGNIEQVLCFEGRSNRRADSGHDSALDGSEMICAFRMPSLRASRLSLGLPRADDRRTRSVG